MHSFIIPSSADALLFFRCFIALSTSSTDILLFITSFVIRFGTSMSGCSSLLSFISPAFKSYKGHLSIFWSCFLSFYQRLSVSSNLLGFYFS